MKLTPRFTYKEVAGNVEESERRYDRMFAMEQAVANQCVEGFNPTTEYLEDCQRFINDELTHEQLEKNIILRNQTESGFF